jgi:phage terminase large subunit
MIKPSVPDCFKYLNKPMRYKGAYGGRGSAKSWSYAAILEWLGMRAPLRILCAREYQISINDSVKSLLDDTIRRCNLGDFYESKKTEIIGRNGTRFSFLGLRHDPQKIKSFEGIDICWNEEAHTTSQESLDVLLPTIRKEGSELWFSYNRKLTDEPVHGLAVRPDADFRHINYDQNPFFPEVLRREMEYDKAHDYEKYKHVWLGEPQQFSQASVFNGKYRVEDFDTPADAEFYFGADWGFSVDPTSLIRCFIDGRKLYIDYETYGVGVEIDDTPEMFDTVPESRKWEIIADSARPETISYMKRKGFRMKGAIKGKDSVVEGVKFLQDYEIICHTRCSHMAYELGAYSYKVDKLTQEVIPVLEDKDNHCIDSLRYAVESVRRKTTFMIS